MQNIWALQTPSQSGPVDLHTSDVSVEQVAGAMGAYVTGLDVASLDPAGLADVRSLLHRHKAIMLRGQSPALTYERYVEFGRSLGDLAIDPYVTSPIPEHPEIMGLLREADDTSYNFGGDWHSDGSYLERPGGLTVLWGRQLPPHGGDTIFSNLELAWHMLSPAFRGMIDGRRALHRATGLGDKQPITRKGDYAAVNFGVGREVIEHYHPIRRVHPETGGSSLFVNQAYTVEIEGCTADESAGILKFLFDWSASPALTCRMVWQPDTILVWDNRNTVHYAVGDYGGYRREMYRLAVTGEAPA